MGAPETPLLLGDLAIYVLFLCRWLIPAEGTDQGATLWIAAAWFALAAIRFWILWRNDRPFQIPLGIAETGVAALVAGHCLSAGMVFFIGGDRRAALNYAWEWLSIGIFWILLKDVLSRHRARPLLILCLLTTLVTLSGLGLWQHFIWYPQQSRQLSQLLELQQELESGQSMTSIDRAQYQQLRNQFGPEFLSLEGGGREMLLARTRDSREPIGRFALTNTFAALLIAGWFLSAGLLRTRILDRSTRTGIAVAAFCCVLLTACLFLTKSRTAAIGILGGLCALAAITIRRAASFHCRTVLKWGSLLMTGIIALAIILSLTGGLDRQILSEAPKSLAYRLEYWQATWRMLMDHPLLGVGPGNFRQNYFAYKLPGASEEILDPHNLILDVWANGGMLALTGLFLLLSGVGKTLWLFLRKPHVEEVPVPERSRPRDSILVGIAAFSAVFLEEWLLEGFVDRQLVCLTCGWLGVLAVVHVSGSPPTMDRLLALLALTALLIHLLGAGGIGMPAVLQLVLLLNCVLVCGTTIKARSVASVSFTGGLSLLSAGFFFACLWTSLVPVVTVARLLDQGRQDAFDHRLLAAAEHFQQAGETDPLAAAPHNELAAMRFARWQLQNGDDARLFQSAIAEKHVALQRNPRDPKEYLTLSNWWLKRFQRDPQPEFARKAAEAAEKGIGLYPYFSPLLTQWAFALEAQGIMEKARDAARRALELDDLNQARGHHDKILPKSDREKLEKLMESDASHRR